MIIAKMVRMEVVSERETILIKFTNVDVASVYHFMCRFVQQLLLLILAFHHFGQSELFKQQLYS